MRFAAVTRISKNTSMLLLGTVLRTLFSFAFIVYAARYLGVEGFGKYALAQHFFELFLSLSSGGLAILVTRETAKGSKWLSHNFAAAMTLGLIVAICAGGVLVLVATLAGYASDTELAIYVASLAIMPAALGALAEAVCVAFEKAEIVAVGTAAEGFVRIAASFTVLLSGFGLIELMLVLVATRCALSAFYALMLSRLLPEIEWRIRWDTLRSLAREWRVFAAETWLATLYLNMDVVVLSLFFGEAAVGLYEAARKLIRLGPVVASSFTTAVFPYIARLYVDAQDTFRQVSQQVVKYILAAVLPAVLTISFLADRIVLLLFDEQYVASIPVLRVLVWLLVPQFLNPFLSRVLYARGQQRRSLVVAFIGLVTFFVIAMALVPTYGVLGTAWSSVCSYYVALVCYLAFCTVEEDRPQLTFMFVRQAAAAAVLCIVLYLMKNTGLTSVLAACVLLYGALLVALGIVTGSDFRLFQELR